MRLPVSLYMHFMLLWVSGGVNVKEIKAYGIRVCQGHCNPRSLKNKFVLVYVCSFEIANVDHQPWFHLLIPMKLSV
jgi:hypothetical protein